MRACVLFALFFSPAAFADYTCTTNCKVKVTPTYFYEHLPSFPSFREACDSNNGYVVQGGSECGTSQYFYCVSEQQITLTGSATADAASEYLARVAVRNDCETELNKQITHCDQYYWISSSEIDVPICTKH